MGLEIIYLWKVNTPQVVAVVVQKVELVPMVVLLHIPLGLEAKVVLVVLV